MDTIVSEKRKYSVYCECVIGVNDLRLIAPLMLILEMGHKKDSFQIETIYGTPQSMWLEWILLALFNDAKKQDTSCEMMC